jgi:cytochrome c oxidase assembly factor CtaG
MRYTPLAVLGLLTVKRVRAHEGGAIPSDVWTHWNLDPMILIALLLPLYLYQRGTATYRIARWRTGMFVAGMGTLAVALLSPLDSISHALFSGHMTQHLLLILVAAPLLVLSQPLAPILRGLPIGWGKGLGGKFHRILPLESQLTHPLTALILHLAALWVWHLPGLYSAALDNPLIHALEHNTFFITALLFWTSLRRTSDYGGRLLSAFSLMMGSGLLGALLTFSRSPWYNDHIQTLGAWGLTPLSDQQLAGVVMWIPMGTVYVVTAALLLAAWLQSVERRVTEREHKLLEEMRDV